MEKKSSWLKDITDLAGLMSRVKGEKGIEDFIRVGKIGAGVGIPYGALTVAANKGPTDELTKIKKLLAAQESQSPSGNPDKMMEALNKTQSMMEFAKKALSAPTLGEALWYTTAAGIPSYQIYDYVKEKRLKKEIDSQRTQQKDLEGKYNQSFKDQMIQELNVDPAAYRKNLETIQKTSASLHPAYPIASSLLTSLAYVKGKEAFDATNPDVQKIKGYRKQLEHIMKMRDKPTFYHSEFTPEELTALEMSRGSLDKKPSKSADTAAAARNSKATKAPVSAQSNSPELQKLLGSI